jgi:hypothetical protein
VPTSHVREQPVREDDREQHEPETCEERVTCLAVQRRTDLALCAAPRSIGCRRCGRRRALCASQVALRGRVRRLGAGVLLLELLRRLVRLERRAICLTPQLEVLQRVPAARLGLERTLLGRLLARDRRIRS